MFAWLKHWLHRDCVPRDQFEQVERERTAFGDYWREERQKKRRFEAGYYQMAQEVEQSLGKALGYPELYPAASAVDDGTVCVGDHVPESLAEEAAETIEKLRKQAEIGLSYRDLAGRIVDELLRAIDPMPLSVYTLTKEFDELDKKNPKPKPPEAYAPEFS